MRSANSLDQYNDDDFFSGGPCPSCRLAINKETGRLKFVRCSKLVIDFIKITKRIKNQNIGNFFFFFILISQVVYGRKRYLALPSEINASDSRRVIADHDNFHRPLEVTGDWQNSLSSYAFGSRD